MFPSNSLSLILCFCCHQHTIIWSGRKTRSGVSVETNIIKCPGSLPGASIKMQEGRSHRAEPHQQVSESPLSHYDRTLQLWCRLPGCCCRGDPPGGRTGLVTNRETMICWVSVFLDCSFSPSLPSIFTILPYYTFSLVVLVIFIAFETMYLNHGIKFSSNLGN